MGLNELVRSKGYKNFMAKLYGIGAAVVIMGALFKILHYPGADYMLLVGMGTESIIFFFSAFEPLHVEYNWSLVYPQLAMGHDDEKKPKKFAQGTITQQLDRALEEAKVGPELLESLVSGMKNLGENAKQLSGVSNSVAATDSFVSSLSKATESIRNLGQSYEKTAEAVGHNSNAASEYFQKLEKATEAMDKLATVYEQTVQTMDTDSEYMEGVSRLSKNLSAINAVYELQLQTTTEALDASKELDAQMRTTTEHLSQSASQVIAYKEQIDMLSKNVSKLNDIYGNMLAAMSK
ncbi:MAG: gliding motility protein GldL [Bacteroidales bacterium]|jgi:gliding motility-associated protein GldL|nr:gliding motility protein GldL [Bacteroidales bacterium]